MNAIDITVTPDWLVVVAGFLLSLAFSYIPKLNTWYAAKSAEFQKLTQAGLIFIILVVVFMLQCFGQANTGLECSTHGVINALIIYALSLAANQGTYKVSVQTKGVKEARASRDAALLASAKAAKVKPKTA